MPRQSVNVVWLKRDLRLEDHPPLQAAIAAQTPIILLFCFEPGLFALPEYTERHRVFLEESIADLNRELAACGARILVCEMEAAEALQRLTEHFQVENLYSHQETGMYHTFQRDREIAAFCREKGIIWLEFDQDGVIRGLKNRKKWQPYAQSRLTTPPVRVDLAAARWAPLPEMPEYSAQPTRHERQPGGAQAAKKYLYSFLTERSENYSKHISKPAQSRRSCSRLSPYLAWGCLSARTVWQLAETHKKQARSAAPLSNFQSRIWWRSHFIQKLESDYEMEWLDINRAFSGLPRNEEEDAFRAWSTGQTGFPLVDASMRSLIHTGYVNFRMRAMLVTFWSFTLWQNWRPGARHLAGLFLDFEPGIHYPQWQMQSGATGYNTLRVYNPTLQFVKQDPDGAFVKQWVPELRHVPAPLLYEPWKMSPLEQEWYQCRIGHDYPAPIVDFDAATRAAKEKYWTFRQSDAVRKEIPRVMGLLCNPG